MRRTESKAYAKLCASVDFGARSIIQWGQLTITDPIETLGWNRWDSATRIHVNGIRQQMTAERSHHLRSNWVNTCLAFVGNFMSQMIKVNTHLRF